MDHISRVPQFSRAPQNVVRVQQNGRQTPQDVVRIQQNGRQTPQDVVRVQQNGRQAPQMQTTMPNGIRGPRREHIYSTIEDSTGFYDNNNGYNHRGNDNRNDHHGDDQEDERSDERSDSASDHGIYSEPEHLYSCIEDMAGGGKKVSVVVEKDSDISEEEGGGNGESKGEGGGGQLKKKEVKENGKNATQMPQLAKALYDNAPESQDEVGFRRGDVLTVLERDHGGLAGWALVRHQGHTGIAPQNRLRLLAGMYDGEGEGGGGEEAKVPQWNRRSWAIEPDKLLTPRKVGDVYIYDQSNQDYDVPPSRYFPDSSKAPPPHRQAPPPSDIYDSPRSLALKNSSGYCPSDYDTPVGSSNSQRSSTVSMLSTGSSNLSVLTTPNSSARSSSEFRSQDIYDVPPAAKPVPCLSPLSPDTRKLDMALESLKQYDIPKNLKNQSFEAGMEIYDTPPRLKPSTSYDDYDYAQIPEDSSSRISSDSGVETKMEVLHITEDIYDTPPSHKSGAPTLAPKKGSRCSLTSVMPAPVPEDLYDIPPMVSRDHPPPPLPQQQPSLLRNKSGRSGGIGGGSKLECSSMEVRSSVCSENSSSGSSDIPSVSYKELKVDLPTALEQLKAAQDDVNKSTKRLLGFVSSSWRKRESLEENLFDVKVSCIAIRTALQEFVDFSEGTVANSVKVQDKKLVKNLVKNLEPVQSFLKQVEQAMKGLEEKKWLMSKLVVNTPNCSQADELGTIVNVARMLPEHCRTLHTIIQANAQLLFEGAKADTASPKKPKPARPPPPTKPKPNRSASVESNPKNQRRSIQERPLPTPPRPLPKPPGGEANSSGSDTPSRTSLSRHSSAVSSSNSRSSRSRSPSPQPPAAFRARSNSDYDNNWGNAVDPRDSSASQDQPQVDYVSLAESARVEPESVHFMLGPNANDSNATSTVDHMGYEMPTSSSSSSLTNTFSERLKKVQRSFDDTGKPKKSRLSNGQTDQLIYDEPSITDDAPSVVVIDENDRMLLTYYAEETLGLTTRLVDVIDGFFGVMRNGGGGGGNNSSGSEQQQPPPPPHMFVEHSKAVIVAGQKLVFVCDTVTRNVRAGDVRDKVLACACHLCECLKATVAATKTAGRDYPDVVALQDMNDRLVDVTHAAQEVKLVITQAASL